MSKTHKPSKQQQEAQDREETRKFLTIVGVAVLVLVLLMYFIFR
ncbi:MAG: hypothetical protein ACK4Q5_10400 [Saprospiraceae bacterium]